MVQIRKIIKMGNARGVTFPSGWLKTQERIHGSLKEVLVKEGEDALVIVPLPQKENAT